MNLEAFQLLLTFGRAHDGVTTLYPFPFEFGGDRRTSPAFDALVAGGLVSCVEVGELAVFGGRGEPARYREVRVTGLGSAVLARALAAAASEVGVALFEASV